MNIIIRVQTQELLKRSTSPEGKTLTMLKQVLELPSVLGWSPELRGWIPPGLKWSNCTMKSVKGHLLLKKMRMSESSVWVSHNRSSNFDYWYTKKNVPPGITACYLLCSRDAGRKEEKVRACSQAGCYSPAAQSIKLFHPSKSFCNITDLSCCHAIVPCW